MAHAQATSVYDQVPYPSLAFARSSIENLCTVAFLYGLQPPPLESCRVLEIGCATGGNLLPMAERWPGSQFLGIDLSEPQIAEADAIRRAAGLSNVRLEKSDVLEFAPGENTFDYVICHGVVSWAPPTVLDGVLDVCRAALSANGVAYINFNTYPGWSVQGTVRDLLQWQTQGATSIDERIRGARQTIRFYLEHGAHESTPLGAWLRNELSTLQKQSDSYLFHAYLNVANRPYYLHQFASSLEQYGLTYVSDADLSVDWFGGLPPATQTALDNLGSSRLSRLQHLDFVQQRTSRHSIVCRTEATPRPTPDWEMAEALYFAAPLRELPAPAGSPAGTRVFRHRNGRSVNTASNDLSSALAAISAAWPESLSWNQLEPFRPTGAPQLAAWKAFLWQCVMAGILDAERYAPACTARVTEYPRTGPLARLQAEQGRPVTNLRHQSHFLSDADRWLLSRLDGVQAASVLASTFPQSGEGTFLNHLARLRDLAYLSA